MMTSKQAALCSSFYMVLMALHACAQQAAPPGAPCGPSAIESHQLPCQENRIAIEWPVSIENGGGRWISRTGNGPWKNVDVAFSAFDREVLPGGCARGSVDLADFFAIWKPGNYDFQLISPDGAVKIGPIHLEIMEPKGVDREVYEKLIIPRITGPLRGQGLLSWVYGDLKAPEKPAPIRNTILEKYPSSTYAGYALLKQGPALSLQGASAVTPEVRDREWYVPVSATPAEQEACRKKARESYEAFVGKAPAFFAAHPDFAETALLRKELAIALFYLDRPSQAWAEVETLSKLTGPSADEAKACLEKHKADKPHS